VANIDARVNPLAIKLCGNPAPRDDLESKLSIAHSAAVALLDGAAGVAQYREARVTDAAVTALCEKVVVNADVTIGTEQARVRILLSNGTAHELFVKHARGSIGRPLSDAELEAKFRGLAATALTPPQIDAALAVCASLETRDDAADLARVAAG